MPAACQPPIFPHYFSTCHVFQQHPLSLPAARTTHLQVIADQMPRLAVRTRYQHRALVVPLLRHAVRRARQARLARERDLVGGHVPPHLGLLLRRRGGGVGARGGRLRRGRCGRVGAVEGAVGGLGRRWFWLRVADMCGDGGVVEWALASGESWREGSGVWSERFGGP